MRRHRRKGSICGDGYLKGPSGVSVVGLAQTTVMESKDRIKSAIINSGYDYPRTRITINFMPAELKKNQQLPGPSDGCRNTRVISAWKADVRLNGSGL